MFELPSTDPLFSYYRSYLDRNPSSFNSANVLFQNCGNMVSMDKKDKNTNVSFTNNFSVIINLIIKIISQDFALILLKWKHAKELILKKINTLSTTNNFALHKSDLINIIKTYRQLFPKESQYQGIIQYIDEKVNTALESNELSFCISQLTGVVNGIEFKPVVMKELKDFIDVSFHSIYDRPLSVNMYFSLYDNSEYNRFESLCITSEEEMFKIRSSLVNHFTKIYHEIKEDDFEVKEFIINYACLTQAFLNKLFFNIKTQTNIILLTQKEVLKITHYRILTLFLFTLESIKISLTDSQKTYIIQMWYHSLKIPKNASLNKVLDPDV